MISSASQNIIDDYWATEMGLPCDFTPVADGISCFPQERYTGVQLFLRNGALVIGAPQGRVEEIARRVGNLSAREVFSVEFVARTLVPGAVKILGPAHVAYADAASFLFAPANGCDFLTPIDAVAQKALAEALSDDEREQSGFTGDETRAFGKFDNGDLCAVASYEIWEPDIAHIMVATRPHHRRCGHARAAISALAIHAFQRGFVLQYRSLASNENSLALGRSLGFEHYCSTIYARLPAA